MLNFEAFQISTIEYWTLKFLRWALVTRHCLISALKYLELKHLATMLILSLPTEVIMEVFKNMGWRDILRASQVSFGGSSLCSLFATELTGEIKCYIDLQDIFWNSSRSLYLAPTSSWWFPDSPPPPYFGGTNWRIHDRRPQEYGSS